MIKLINKNVKKENIKGHFIFAHEHLDFDLTHIRKDEVSKMKNKSLIEEELSVSVDQGLALIVEMSNQSMNSNKDALLSISKKCDLPLVMSTGYYLNEYEYNNTKSIVELETEFTSHILDGVGKNKLKAGIIGEIATSSEKIFDFEKKVFQAAINVQKKLGVPIYTHLNLGANAINQVNMIISMGGNPSKIIIGHVDLVENFEEVLEILKKGFYIGIDTIGKTKYLSDELRIERIIKLIENGYENKIVISLDISNQTYLKSTGGHGYGYLIDGFYPMIKNLITDAQWRKISFLNILDVLDIKEEKCF